MAVSLGRSSGATLIGRPLDITVQATLEAADANALSCLEAEVFYADERIDKSRVRTSFDSAAATGPDTLIRIRVARPVDEPVVTVYLRAGCGQRTERRYVLLADVAPDQVPAARPTDLATRPVAPATASVPAPAPVAATSRSWRDPSAADAAGVRPATRSADPAPRTRRATARQTSVKASPRLKLEPIDLSVETFPQLRLSSELLTIPVTSSEQRDQAAALWKALSTQPEDVLAAAAKVAAIEAAVRGLQVETRKNRAAVAELDSALQTAREERYANGLVYGLLAALVLALAALVYFWRRSPLLGSAAPNDKLWWDNKGAADTGWHSALGPIASGYSTQGGDSETSVPPPFGDQAARVMPKAAPRRAGSRRGVPSRLPPLSRRDQTDFGLSMPHTPPRAAKAEELLDIQHQADFFVSIGQENRAIDILLDHIGDDVQSSALIYLDLFDLYHKLGRKADFNELAASFVSMFNAKIPAFEVYAGSIGNGRGLESYAAPLGHIRSAWPRPAVLAIMEAMIFCSPHGQSEPFEPEAFRDLLILYGVAREIVDAELSSPAVLLSDFDLPDLASLARPDTANPSLEAMHADALPVIEAPHDTALGLDIDLTALVGAGSSGGDSSGPARIMPGESGAPADANNLIDFENLTLSSRSPSAGEGR